MIGADRRWCAATRRLRLSYQASRARHRGAAADNLIRALITHPESIGGRPFWGCLHQLFRRTLQEIKN
jgi:hypothetical protein